MNAILEYLTVCEKVRENLSLEGDIIDADDGDNYYVQEGKEEAIAQVDHMIRELSAFKKDIKNMSLRKLQNKY